jgi:hypothetical protein
MTDWEVAEGPRRRPPPRPPSYDEVGRRGDGYDPSPPYYGRSQWDDGALPPPSGEPQAPRYEEPRYSFAPPPPPAPYPMYPPPYAYPFYPPPRDPMRNKSLPVVGGVLCIISGAIGMVWLALTWGFGGMFWFGGIFGACAAIQVTVSVIAVVGGIFAMMRRVFAMAIIGGICAMLSGGLMFAITVVLGLLATILIAIGKDSFMPFSYGQVPAGPPFYR